MKRRCILFSVLIALCISLAMPVHGYENPELEQLIIESCTYDKTVYLSSYRVTGQQLDDIFNRLLDSGKLPWYVAGNYHYEYQKDTGYITEFSPEYMDKNIYDRNLYEKTAAQVIHETVFDGMQPWQIALSIHDYLIANSAYDESLVAKDGYDLLVNGSAVCNGYAEAYMDLMNRCGIPTVIVSSNVMNHCWNLVYIEGNWYHVDVTWDDPVSDVHGRVSHNYFLLTDDEIRNDDTPHYNWNTDISCTDTSFSNAFWRGIDSRICYADSNNCYLLREDNYSNYIYHRDEQTQKETLLYADEKAGLDIGSGRYYYPHMGLSLWNDKLYFSDTVTCYSMNTDGSEVLPVFRYDAAGNNKHIYGIALCDSSLCLTLRTHEGKLDQMTIPLAGGEDHEHTLSSQVIAPTCTAGGMTVHSCDCGFFYTSDPTPKTEHHYEETVIQELTLTTEGESVFTCSVCNDSYTQYYTAFNPIDWIMEEDYRMYAAIAIGFLLILRLFRKPKKNRS